jgi:phage terminase large subunit
MINYIQSTWASIFNPLLKLGKWRYKIFHGGRGGAKTQHFARALLKLTQEYKINVLCCREVQNSIEDSVYKVLRLLIEKYELSEFDVKKDKIINIVTGSVFIFKGLRKETVDSLKSLEGIDICWIEEAHAVTHRSWEVLDPSIRADHSELWISFNRKLPNDPVWDRYCKNPDDETFLKKVNWDDNPYFPDTLRKVKDRDYKRDPLKARHIWEGDPEVRSEALIFNGYWEVKDFRVEGDVRYYHGNDWGFANDPTILIRCFELENCLYIDKAVGAVKCDIGKDTANLFNRIDTAKNWPIASDSARPESISMMRKYGFSIFGAKKGKGSIEDGIQHLKSYDMIYIHSSLTEVIKEFATYSYKVDKVTEEILPIIIDANNHYIDGLRYALEKVMKARQEEQTEPEYSVF